MLPNFLVIGAQRSGTTSLFQVLKRHPQVFIPDVKEVNFFFHDNHYRRGVEYYQSFFKGAPSSALAVCEASPGYICKPGVAQRIHDLMPQAKLVAVLRNPVDRAYSQYWDNRRFLAEPLSFEQAIDVALTPEYRHGERGYFSRGAYINQIESYLELFKRERMLVLIFEDLKQDPEAVFGRCFDFLGVDPSFRCPEMTRASNSSMVWDNPVHSFFLKRNKYQKWVPKHWIKQACRGPLVKRKYPPMSRQARERLLEFYRPYNRRLEAFLGRDLERWNR
ncbi:MAG: sulfotransferase domain-containing protein [Desulfarculaceae bacterium]|nr:sulfotransferase domain-containing protein [Desulfarculaceae bacterium]MCF8047549.1 sulfotransferase domain-containing protein [Desulfarculaceae bacterium]MCF8064061.1 sulfotransferase domain-containing protein [Desulfarculaceae bacterium]MCF8096612.1 sulfotransferase domain-containing protein [Desulfarculaceae bacterium]MCF8122270.1 sulfotransferase domain-containing protein [Desulfarculaceae bacterium]